MSEETWDSVCNWYGNWKYLHTTDEKKNCELELKQILLDYGV